MSIGSNIPEEELKQFVQDLDDLMVNYFDMGTHIITGALLSRVVLIMQQEPYVGKNLIRYAWEKLDEIEQTRPPSVEE